MSPSRGAGGVRPREGKQRRGQGRRGDEKDHSQCGGRTRSQQAMRGGRGQRKLLNFERPGIHFKFDRHAVRPRAPNPADIIRLPFLFFQSLSFTFMLRYIGYGRSTFYSLETPNPAFTKRKEKKKALRHFPQPPPPSKVSYVSTYFTSHQGYVFKATLEPQRNFTPQRGPRGS